MGANVDARRDLRSRDRNTMVKKCRYAERNYGLYNQILNDTVMYVVGGGMRMQAHCEDAEVGREHMEYFYEVSRKLDITGRFSFEDCQKLITRSWMRDGDTFAAKVVLIKKAAATNIVIPPINLLRTPGFDDSCNSGSSK
jgi:capsid protein